MLSIKDDTGVRKGIKRFFFRNVVPVRISNQSSRHCWRSPLPNASVLIQRNFGCVLGVQQTKQLLHVAKVDLVWQLGQSLSHHRPQVFYQQKIRRASRPRKQFNLVIDEEPLDNAFHVWSHIILLKYGCGQALKVRLESDHRGVVDRCVISQLRQLHSILPLTSIFHSTIGGGDVCGSASRVDQAMDILRTDHPAVNDVEWYAQTLNDSLQTQCAVLQFVM
ncbi:uncharacterized protein TNCV_1604431 [Trichonephila clavipes]|nr:uncharacterized protein TNCV_1604431 [Trichonephila clavipes]